MNTDETKNGQDAILSSMEILRDVIWTLEGPSSEVEYLLAIALLKQVLLSWELMLEA